jgi:hypothetical protein
MSRRQVVRNIAREMPADLKELRGKLMIEVLCATLGVEEVACPACNGSGWLDRRSLERCPVCCGFLEVPDRLAEWFRAEFRRGMAPQGASRAPRGSLPEYGSAGSAIERHGRIGEVAYSVCLPSTPLES